MRQKSPETYEEKLAQLEELREAAIHHGVRGRRREAARQGQVHGPRADREAARPGLLPGARHVRAPPHDRVRDAEEPAVGRRGDHRPRHDRRPARVRLLPGLHGLRRLARRGHGREDVQDHGPGGQDRLPRDRHQRLGRRPHPGGRRLARRLRRRLRAQRPLLRRDPADQPDHGPVRGRGGLLPGHHGLHLHGQGDLAHVHHGPRRDQDGHGRGGRVRGARRRDEPQLQVRRRALRVRRRGPVPRGHPLPVLLPAAEQPRDGAARAADRRPDADGPRAGRDRPGQREQALRHARRRARDRRRRRVLRGPGALRAEHHLRLLAPRRLLGRHRRQPAARDGGRARHRRQRQGGALRAHLRRVQHPAADLRRRAGLPARARPRSGAASSATARSCCTRSPRRRSRRSP